MMIIRGVDTLEFGLDIIDYYKKFRPFLYEFQELKEEGQNTGKEQYINLNDLRLKVELSGMRFYAYRLTCADFIIGFAEKITKENPHIRVKFMSGYLWSYGYQAAYEIFLEWFKYFQVEIITSRLSRLDICVDTDETTFNEDDIGLFIARAKSKSKHFVSDEYTTGRKFSGFTIGRGNPMLARIYNKSEEIKTKSKVWFKTIWSDNNWDENKDVWRVEFQVRRKALKEFGLNEVEEIKDNEERLWKYLTTMWLKMNHDKWNVIINTNEPLVKPSIREKVLQGDITRLINQTNGLIITIGAYLKKDDIKDVLIIIKEQAEKRLRRKGTNYKSEVYKKRSSFLSEK